MKRLLVLFIALIVLSVSGLVLVGCQDESAGVAEELGIENRQREKPAEKRAPPGPEGGGSFVPGDQEAPEGTEPPEPPDG